jgi:deazaflavin-dependent oxidoreductase (nitroreductase family)
MKEAHMRNIAVVLAVPVAIGAVFVGAAGSWRRHPRVGTAFVNSVVNPVLLRRGLAGKGRSEIATLEHVGRRSGMKRLTPVHPEATQNGFRIVVPLGMQSEWARNVIAAGRCRILLHDQVFDLDEPAMVDAGEAHDLPWPLRGVMAALGFQYLNLRTFAAHSATLPS